MQHAFPPALAVALAAVTFVSPATEARDRPSPRDAAAPIVIHVDDGFDWGDAAIGAAGAFGLAMLGGGAFLVWMATSSPRNAPLPRFTKEEEQ